MLSLRSAPWCDRSGCQYTHASLTEYTYHAADGVLEIRSFVDDRREKKAIAQAAELSWMSRVPRRCEKSRKAGLEVARAR
jgi:hypothetical protein